MTNTKHTKEIYNKNAEYYHAGTQDKDNVWHFYIEKPAMIKFLKREIKGKKVLDLGCGSGPFVKKLIALGAEKVSGIDLSSGLIAIAKRENPISDFYVGDAKKTPFENSEFDIVSSSLMVHYFKELNPLFKEVSRILKQGGLFAFSMHHPVMEVTGRLEVNGAKTNTIEFRKYFHNDLYHWKLKDSMDMIAYHHTFENIFNNLEKNGFVVESLLEPKAPQSAEKINKKVYDRSNFRPSFLVIKARKK